MRNVTFNRQCKIVSVDLVDGKLVVVRQYPSNMMYMSIPPKPFPDEVVKQTYGVEGGSVVLLDTVTGHHEPAYTVDEKITFPESDQ